MEIYLLVCPFFSCFVARWHSGGCMCLIWTVKMVCNRYRWAERCVMRAVLWALQRTLQQLYGIWSSFTMRQSFVLVFVRLLLSGLALAVRLQPAELTFALFAQLHLFLLQHPCVFQRVASCQTPQRGPESFLVWFLAPFCFPTRRWFGFGIACFGFSCFLVLKRTILQCQDF